MTDPLHITDPDPSEAAEVLDFRAKERLEDELDMTPMVDITFLLLIFFMVTAAFAKQKSIEVPPPDQQESAKQQTIEDLERNDDYVIVRIDREDTIWVTVFGSESAATSEQELLEKLREAREGMPGSDSLGPSSLLVLANGDCHHETVVMALDAGSAVGMQDVRLATVDETDF